MVFNRVNHYTVNYDKLTEIKLNQLTKPVVVDSDKLAQSDSDTLAQSLRDYKDINKESGHSQKIEGDVLQTREDNADSIPQE